ncbi:MAG: hypothetical protein QOJ93_1205 [Actinomycetota bacterium]|nr:hypothetical protein [Actinomycetota bacterium]
MASTNRSEVGLYVLLEIATTNGQLEAPFAGCCKLTLETTK